jgi:hypothetical protein
MIRYIRDGLAGPAILELWFDECGRSPHKGNHNSKIDGGVGVRQ